MKLNALKIFLSIICMVIIHSTDPVFARNVSYKEGWTLLGNFDDDSVSSLIHFTPHRKFSLGYRYEYFRDKEWHYNGLQMNYLAKRWNNPDSQANLYVLSSIGGAYSRYQDLDDEREAAGFVGVATDWEDRRFFISYENRYVQAGDIDEFLSQKARVGVAPYVAEFGGLHTWIMLEFNYNEKRDDNVTLTPLVRLFKGNVMTELGWTIDGSAMANIRILF